VISFKGCRVETQEMVHIGAGILALIDKHIYFGGEGKLAHTAQ